LDTNFSPTILQTNLHRFSAQDPPTTKRRTTPTTDPTPKSHSSTQKLKSKKHKSNRPDPTDPDLFTLKADSLEFQSSGAEPEEEQEAFREEETTQRPTTLRVKLTSKESTTRVTKKATTQATTTQATTTEEVTTEVATTTTEEVTTTTKRAKWERQRIRKPSGELLSEESIPEAEEGRFWGLLD
jgi:hypothetical protein